MTVVKFTPADIAQSTLLETDWFEAKIEDIEFKPSKDKESNNYVTRFTILKNGKVIVRYFNDKYIGYMIPFFEALLKRKVTPSDELDPSLAKGKNMNVHVITVKDDKGQLRNDIDGFRPSSS